MTVLVETGPDMRAWRVQGAAVPVGHVRSFADKGLDESAALRMYCFVVVAFTNALCQCVNLSSRGPLQLDDGKAKAGDCACWCCSTASATSSGCCWPGLRSGLNRLTRPHCCLVVDPVGCRYLLYSTRVKQLEPGLHKAHLKPFFAIHDVQLFLVHQDEVHKEAQGGLPVKSDRSSSSLACLT
jgi:hypothetical protein